jgi:predicted  nucleic acid-binding Zn-ribbon protein
MTATLEGESELIRSTVVDEDRAEKLIGLLAERDRLVAEQTERISDYRERMRALNADYGAERVSFDEAVASYNAGRQEWQREVAELVSAMKAETTAEEWKSRSPSS